jgi:hypothetical protein
LIVIDDADFDKAKHCVEELKRVRRRAGVPIAEMEARRYHENEVMDDPYSF